MKVRRDKEKASFGEGRALGLPGTSVAWKEDFGRMANPVGDQDPREASSSFGKRRGRQGVVAWGWRVRHTS